MLDRVESAEPRRLKAPEPRRSIFERVRPAAEPRRLEAQDPRRSILERVESAAEPRRLGAAELRLRGAFVLVLPPDGHLAPGLASRADNGPVETRIGAGPLSCWACRRSSSSCPATVSPASSLQVDRPHAGAEPLWSPCPPPSSSAVSVRPLPGGIHACCCAASRRTGLEHEAMVSAPGSDRAAASDASIWPVLVNATTRSSAPSIAKATALPPPSVPFRGSVCAKVQRFVALAGARVLGGLAAASASGCTTRWRPMPTPTLPPRGCRRLANG